MKKAKYLTGESLTFLDYVLANSENLFSGKCGSLSNFYSQPFTKDMIVRPDEPKSLEDRLYDDFMNAVDPAAQARNEQEWSDEYNRWLNWEPLFEGDWRVITQDENTIIALKGHPKTIVVKEGMTTDDFIREAKQAGIKLAWK